MPPPLQSEAYATPFRSPPFAAKMLPLDAAYCRCFDIRFATRLLLPPFFDDAAAAAFDFAAPRYAAA